METLKILKDPTEMASRSLQPAMWLLIFGEAFNRLHAVPTGGLDYLSFLTPGILAQSITFVSIFNGLSIIWEKDMGLMQKLLTRPSSIRPWCLARCWPAPPVAYPAGGDFGGGRFFEVSAAVGGRPGGRALLLTVLGSALFSGLSMVIASIVRRATA